MISVIVPIYNVELYVDKCIRSVIEQSYDDFELILVDDGSPDRSGAICDEWAAKDNRIRVIHKANGGLSDARNAGLENAKGEYICFVDSDDWIDHDMLKTLFSMIDRNDVDMSCCNFLHVNSSGEAIRDPAKITSGVLSQDEYWAMRFSSNLKMYFDVACGKLYRRKLFESVRYPVGIINEDDHVIFDIVNQCNLIAITDQIGYYYLIRDNSIMRSPRGIRNLSAPRAFIKWTEGFIAKKKWFLAEESLIYAVHELLLSNYVDGVRKSDEYRAIKRSVFHLYSVLFLHLSIKRKVSILLFCMNEPLARKMNRNYVNRR
jgi:glycosyltransferase involved in cell wall biosynthesis